MSGCGDCLWHFEDHFPPSELPHLVLIWGDIPGKSLFFWKEMEKVWIFGEGKGLGEEEAGETVMQI